MIDDNFKVWLIEVNTNPCLEESSGLLKILLPRMLSYIYLGDSFKLTIEQVLPNCQSTNIFPVKNYSDQENLWELI